MFMSTVIILLTSASFTVDHFGTTIPPAEILEGLYWVRDNFDWRTTIIMISKSTYSMYMGWAQAIPVAHLYQGYLFDLLSGKPRALSANKFVSNYIHSCC